MREYTNIRQCNESSFAFFLFLPLVLAPLVNFIPSYLFLTKFFLALCFIIAGSQNVRIYSPGVFVLLSFLFCSTLWSVSAPLSVYALMPCCYYGIIFLLFRCADFNERALRWGFRLIVVVSLLVAFDGVHQYIFRYDEYASYLQAHDPFGSQELEQAAHTWITALSGRVFTQFFALPSQLAGYLLMMLPLNAVLMFQETRKGLKVFWGIVLILNGLVFFLTKSFGAWLVFLCMLVITTLLWLWNKQILTWRWLLKIGAGFLIAGMGLLFLIGYVRGQYLWDFQGNNPLWYRWLNWKTALAIWRDHPFIGTGPGTFGVMYPQYMQPGANETQYAHNTYLQFGAELGIIGFIVILFLAGAWCFYTLKGFKQSITSEVQTENPYALYGIGGSFAGLGFLLHNIIDFDFYVFPLGLLGMAMLGGTLNIFSSRTAQNVFPLKLKSFFHEHRPAYLCFIGLLGICSLLLLVKDWQHIQASQEKEQAVVLLQAQHYSEALQSIQFALQSAPTPPEYHAITGSILLYLRQPEQAIEHFRIAIESEPVTPWFHAAIAEAYLQQQNLSLAYVEIRRAAELFPLKTQYQHRLQQIQQQFPQ